MAASFFVSSSPFSNLLREQRMRPFCTAIDVLDGYSYASHIRFCFENDEYPYCVDVMNMAWGSQLQINNAYNGDNDICAKYENHIQCSDELYSKNAKLFFKDKESKEQLTKLIYKIAIGDLPIAKIVDAEGR